MNSELTTDDIVRLTDAATRWSRRITGVGNSTTRNLPILAAQIGGMISGLNKTEDNARLVWEGKHIHALLSRAQFTSASS